MTNTPTGCYSIYRYTSLRPGRVPPPSPLRHPTKE
ncbi:hypothetical protein [Pseudomonas phage vB_PaeM_RP7]|nr:MAG: hypothetical protein [Pseudomonas phage RP4]WAB56747.1 hypothetical protein [Pseudomonas phage vB_PaeM_RP15]WAB57033.1 hypothetical protein [Pseudomonas phage vB_PaeM_RP6]WAB57058.1 hypothetical protein [Pseudomonas phage vB_PaeM_RP7]WAB57367.1 hypothetical protein [Pseudomonas phage vB_PaeM_RP8]WAB57543.1 hypothetical protein [Pseudomonas phage vB_PaeM_RP9]WAB57660.1 hypothetical protein [Pseudomonas phage vB_PaeM_RP10]WAB57776.1 hypothetical protein [Pseudomonas phage vB_PaeM_RP11]